MTRATLALACLLAAAPAAAQVRIDNGKMTRHDGAAGLERAFRPLVKSAGRGAGAPEKSDEPFWIAYAVPVVDGDRVMCCWRSGQRNTWVDDGVVLSKSGDACCGACGLEPGRNDGINVTRNAPDASVQLWQSRFSIFFRVVSGAIERVRVFSEECAIDAGGRIVHWIDDVKAAESVALLMTFVPTPATETRRDRIVDGAITAIALHGDPAADAALDTLVARDRPDHLRKKAAFWMGQARGRRGFETLRRMVADDPSIAFRKSAVFALSQSSEPEAIPTIIDLAKRDQSSEIRGEALFWLAQKAGRKAAETITEAIEKDPETDVKKRAVFALSQLPKDEGVPLLITVARTNRNPVVRKQAMFWLGQSKDARAIAFFEEILK
jgi:HEAT repeat protein